MFSRKVPEHLTPWCACGIGHKTVPHLILECPDLAIERRRLPLPIRNRRELRARLADRRWAPCISRWLLALGRLSEYRVALKLRDEEEPRERWLRAPAAEATPPPEELFGVQKMRAIARRRKRF